MSAIDVLALRDQAHRAELQRIGQTIGYGNAQSILGQLWDEMLDREYPSPDGVSRSGRGRMGVTIDDRLPPLPKSRKKRREQRGNGGYKMVPAYTEAEMKAYALEAIAKATGEAQR